MSPENTENQNQNEENTDLDMLEEDSGKGGLIAALVIFIILFAASAGLHLYQQWQLGDDGFAWTIGEADQQERVMTEELEEEKAQLQRENEDLRQQLAELEEEQTEDFDQVDWTTGTHYEVQIGAFKFFDMSMYEDGFEQMRMEWDGDFSHITVGRFSDLERARQFLQDIERLGVEKPFIVERVDGQREGVVE